MRKSLVLALPILLMGCAGTPRVQEVAVVECEASPSGEVRNCELVSQTVAGSEFGAEAVAIVARGKLRPDTRRKGWMKFQVTVPGQPVG